MRNKDIFVEKLRSSGLRPTKQRIEICKLLFDRKSTFHFSIDYLNNLPSVVPTKEETYLSLKNHISKNIRGTHFGVLLSGGVDSSVIAKICKDLGRPFRCFCVGIEGSKDIFHANRISDFFGFDLVAKEYTIQEVEVLLKKVIDILPRPVIKEDNYIEYIVKVTVSAVLLGSNIA